MTLLFVLSFAALSYFAAVYFFEQRHPELTHAEAVDSVKKFVRYELGYAKTDFHYAPQMDYALREAIIIALHPYIKNDLRREIWRTGENPDKVPCVGFNIITATTNDFPVMKTLVRNAFAQHLENLGIPSCVEVDITPFEPNKYVLVIWYGITKKEVASFNKFMSFRLARANQRAAQQVSVPIDKDLEAAISDSPQKD